MESLELPKGTFESPREGLMLEYKEARFALPKTFWETVSAFANTEGGWIVLGVAEKPIGTYEVIGVDVPEQVLKQLWNDNANVSKINRALLKEGNVKTSVRCGKTLIEVYVPRISAYNKPIYLNGHPEMCFIRTDDGDRRATIAEYKYFVVDSQPNVDAELLSHFDLSDLNLNDVHLYRQTLGEKAELNYLKSMTDQEFLISLGVFKRDRMHATPDYQLTTGGLLFFGKYESIRDRFPHFQLDYFRYNTNHDHDWLDRVSTGDLHYPELNVYSFYRIVSEKLPAGVMDPFTQDERQTRTSYAADLRQAMKEALVNCLMHPYYDGETSVKIRDREHYTEFINPGTMRVSPESFVRGAESLTRNNVIAGLFRKIGISERAASGGPRIFQSAMKNRLHTPDLLMNDTTTTLRIWKVDILASLNGAEQLTTQEQAVLKILEAAEFRPYKLNELIKEMARLRYSDYAIRKAVNSLVSKNILSTYGRTKNKVYYLSLSNEAGMIENFRLLKLIENLEMGHRRSNTK